MLLHGVIVLQLLLVLAALVLEPHTDDLWTQTGDFHQVFLHECVWPRVVGIDGSERLQLLLRQNSAHTRTLVRVGALGGDTPWGSSTHCGRRKG